MKKKIILLFMMSVLVLMTACGEEKTATNFEYNQGVMVAINQSLIDQYKDVSDLEYDYYSTEGTDVEKAAVSGFKMAETTDHVGSFVGFDTSNENVRIVDGNDGQILCTTRCIYKNRNVDVTVYYKENKEFNLQKSQLYETLANEAIQAGYNNLDQYVAENYADYGFSIDSADAFLDDVIMNNGNITPYKAVDVEVSAVYSREELLKKAGINTGIGMITVFSVLIFIAFIIYLLKFVPMMLEGKKKEEPKAEVKKEVKVASVPIAPAAAEEELDPDKDHELIAVITAALYAYLGNDNVSTPVCTDSNDRLVVRSIRRVR